MMGRRDSRENAFKILYQADIQKCNASELVDNFFEQNTIPQNDKLYIKEVISGVDSNIEVIDKCLSKSLKSWTLNRISKIDKAALRLALYEIMYKDDVPDSIAIYEAVELVKKYNTESAGGFVNGTLRAIARQKDSSGEKSED
ncbi:MAG: transcription antitermination factor NusB [Clostridia bacterium]|nr:transcription antitermination factor NusB [Clostridia bacterium]